MLAASIRRCPRPNSFCREKPLPDISFALDQIANGRSADPLAPVTVVAPSHAAALQLRRRLAERIPFAAVRFETLPRLAELLGAGRLAGAGRSPLARPIGDYVAEQVARESRETLAGVADLPGYARVLRQIFRRLRRGGIRTSAEVLGGPYHGLMPEVLRLYDSYREETAGFYDEEDLLDGAAGAVRDRSTGALVDLGAVYVMPPGAQTAAGRAFLSALRAAAPAYHEIDEAEAGPDLRFVLAPDPSSEAREVAREVLVALEAGVALHEIAVFHGADPSYRKLLRETFQSAGIPAVPLPGIPLSETATGRGVLGLALLADRDFSRTAALDVLSVAPLRNSLPGRAGPVPAMVTLWDKLSREAGITRGADVWRDRLGALIKDRQTARDEYERSGREGAARMAAFEHDATARLLDVIEALIERLEPLRERQPAQSFIDAFSRTVREYLRPDAEALEDVEKEIAQLGTVGAVGGSFGLASFGQALSANLDAAYQRPNTLGSGVVIADYRVAAGLQFRHVVLCGAYEGVLPAGPGTDALVPERTWELLRRHHPMIEDAALRIERADDAARRAIASAGGGALVWSAPLYEAGGTRDYYPSPLMIEAASRRNGSVLTGSGLRAHRGADGWLRRASSPLGARLRGPLLETDELRIRRAVRLRQDGGQITAGHPRWRALTSLRLRRSDSLTEWDGNLSGLDEKGWLELQQAVSPTSLENYALCGFKYLCRSLLRIDAVEEPEEREMMEPAARGSLVHGVLERFFREQQSRNRPGVREAWTDADADLLIKYMEDALAEAKARGLTGLDVYGQHEARTMRADLRRFLEEDTIFRRTTGAVPVAFEAAVPEVEIAGVRLRGYVDRVDRTPDGRAAWVIDYKTGSSSEFEAMNVDPLAGGKKLQLPVYLAAADAQETRALYWFISQKGGFEQIAYEPTPDNQGRFAATLRAIVEGIRAGSFPAVSGEEDDHFGGFKNCRYCDFTRICSRRRDLEIALKAGDPAMSPWRDVGQAATKGGGE